MAPPMLAGEAMKWSVHGIKLTVGTDVIPFVLQPDGLLLTVGAVQVAWKKIGGAEAYNASTVSHNGAVSAKASVDGTMAPVVSATWQS